MAEDVVNEIVATVLEVSAEAGQRVEVGDTLVLLESMKMEIPVLAEDPGVLAEIKVNVGDVIQAGEIIATYKQD
ncbi:biotin/lipoyl-binding carrier protein [Gordonia hydrophobica]|uniref:Biotin/lipoyl-binding carrier protein n=1 Tax=Gordonia hydrophobica TaxID=40516 RepID=A0ABZ2TWY5_9ACTN|nr:biotin/lipoyl-binding carrier protein [Gordonia hydrophobica]MBM7366198.1 biotin carboxyl carrier protein [Gordonia hydrophobica]